MRKILLMLGILSIAFVPSVAGATKPGTNPVLVDGHKVFICHNVSHNPHVILVDVASVDTDGNLKGGHGVWPDQSDLSSFIPHDSGGHDQDFLFLSDETKPDCPADEEQPPTMVLVCVDDVVISMTAEEAAELELDVIDSDDAEIGDFCGVEETTTTTAPEVTTTTVGVTVVPAPPAPAVSVAVPVAAPSAPVSPVSAPTGQLPHTGSTATILLALGGAGMIALGSALRFFRKRPTSNSL